MKRDPCLTISGPAQKINSRWLTDRVTRCVSWMLFQCALSHSRPNGRRVHFFFLKKAQSMPISKGEMSRIFLFAWRTSVPESPWADCERPDHSAGVTMGRTKRKEPELEDGRIPTCPEEKCAETVKTGFPGKETSTVATYAKYSLSASEDSKTQEQNSPVWYHFLFPSWTNTGKFYGTPCSRGTTDRALSLCRLLYNQKQALCKMASHCLQTGTLD